MIHIHDNILAFSLFPKQNSLETGFLLGDTVTKVRTLLIFLTQLNEF